VISRDEFSSADLAAKGGYLLAPRDIDDSPAPDVLLMATGSEVHLALAAKNLLAQEAINAWVISLPCLEWFDQQPESYRNAVLPPSVGARVSIEAGSTQGWYKYLGTYGIAIGVNSYGASGAPARLFEKFGLTAENITTQAKASVAKAKEAS
jgi:transketolase